MNIVTAWPLVIVVFIISQVVMMVGLPGSGKTHWAQAHMLQNPRKRYNLLSTNSILKCMRVRDSIKIIVWNWNHIDTMPGYNLFISMWKKQRATMALIEKKYRIKSLLFDGWSSSKGERLLDIHSGHVTKSTNLIGCPFFHQSVLKKWLEQINCMWMLIHINIHIISCDEYYAVNVPLP